VTKETIRIIESVRREGPANKLRIDTLERLAFALGVDPIELVRFNARATRVYLQRKARMSHLVAVG
jgi:DNA-binding Xre family transcriptional regulator